jgi:hypothetical protein
MSLAAGPNVLGHQPTVIIRQRERKHIKQHIITQRPWLTRSFPMTNTCAVHLPADARCCDKYDDDVAVDAAVPAGTLTVSQRFN